MHLNLLNGAMQGVISDDYRSRVVWSPFPDQGLNPCQDFFKSQNLPKRSRGYIQVFLDGGLNQQRMGVHILLYKEVPLRKFKRFIGRFEKGMEWSTLKLRYIGMIMVNLGVNIASMEIQIKEKYILGF
ncbi:O-fucosyltransferase 31-like [Henckelia pumila]|uniref:O-fucosyltransferase 31-like n=1 Tax=Henckelia pumila TaxID=405737 RepID=UPI003C6DFB53